MQSLKPNAVVDSRFEIVELLGSGGMGAVYKARQIELERLVALKFLLPHLVEDEQSRARMKVEADALASLTHPNICLFYSYSVWHGRTPYIAMEYLDAPNLSELMLQDGGRLSWRRTLNIVAQICKATAHAHSQGIIHRDLKPSNIFVIPGDRVKVTDFGLAKIVDDDDELRQKLTRTGLTLGSPHYMSPEQARAQSVTGATDVYSVGCIMYECLFGRPPFDGNDAVEILYQHQNRQCPLPSEQQAAGLPRGIVELLKTALAKDPAERFQSMDEMAAAVEKVSSDSQNMRDAKSRFSSGGHSAPLSTEDGGKSRTRKLTKIALTSIAITALAACGIYVANPDLIQRTQLDAALQTARSRNDPYAAVKIEMQQVALYQKSHQSDKEQDALTDLARDLSAAVNTDTYRNSSDQTKRQFVGSAHNTLTAWKPATEATLNSLVFKAGSIPAEEYSFHTALRLSLMHPANPQKYRQQAESIARLILDGQNSPYRETMIQLFERKVSKFLIPGTDSTWLTSQLKLVKDAAGRGSEDELAEAALPLYYYYCIREQSPKATAALREASIALNQAAQNKGEDFHPLVTPLHLCNAALTSYCASVGDKDSIEFYRSAISNELKFDKQVQDLDLLAYWRMSLATALREQGKLDEALDMYAEAIKGQNSYFNRITAVSAFCQVSRGDIFYMQKKWQQASDCYGALAKVPWPPDVSKEHLNIASNQQHFANAQLFGMKKFMADLHSKTDPYLKLEPPEDKDACWKIYTLFRDQGNFYDLLGDHTQAMVAYDNAFRFATNPDQRAWIWGARARNYSRAGNEKACLEASEATVNEWKTRATDKYAHIFLLESEMAFARAQRHFGHLARAKDILLAAEADAQHIPAIEGIQRALDDDLSSLYADQGDTAQAIEYMNRVLDWDVHFGNLYLENHTRGILAYLKKDYEAADFYLRKSLYYQHNWHCWEYPRTLTSLAKVRLATGDKAEAKRLLKNALNYWGVITSRNQWDIDYPDYLFALSQCKH